MKFSLILLAVILNLTLSAQTKLKPGFDAQEFLDVLKLEWAHQDSGSKYGHAVLPLNYKRVYRSPEVGLKNKFDFWLRDDTVGVICLRYTVGGTSWLENFYSGMIKAQGSLKLNDSTTFNYKFSNDEKAFVHHGIPRLYFLESGWAYRLCSSYLLGRLSLYTRNRCGLNFRNAAFTCSSGGFFRCAHLLF